MKTDTFGDAPTLAAAESVDAAGQYKTALPQAT
jgi:hypothetical protein